MVRRLEIVTNVAILAAAVSILVFNVTPLFSKRAALKSDHNFAYTVGERIGETAEIQFTEKTFILATASTCRFCTESMELYRRLAESGARLIAVTAEPLDLNAAYLAKHGVRPATVVSARANGLRFRSWACPDLVDRLVSVDLIGRLSSS